MYIAKDNGDGTFNIYMPEDTQDMDGNTITVLGQPVFLITPNDLAEKQGILDSITACQGGIDIKTQYANNVTKAATLAAQKEEDA